jgi:2-polyprenyl-6-methoxyphenol hydroxylase-like FAD-dependent oxidoreductase
MESLVRRSMPLATPAVDGEVVVIGGSVAGMATALALGRTGHRVTVLERDPLPEIADAEMAFATERRGTPQSHQTHGFLARMTKELREHFPDVFDALIASGIETVSPAESFGDTDPSDHDLTIMVIRRTTFELALRRAVLAQEGVTRRSGVGVEGLVATEGTGDPPLVTGVTLSDGSVVSGSVIACTGRRSDVPRWLSTFGVTVPEEVTDTELIYLTRWYRHREVSEVEVNPRLGGDLGFLKYLAIPGDGDTLSLTLAIGVRDAELRRALVDPVPFDRACRFLPGPGSYFEADLLTPISEVRPMGGFINRLRRFTRADGRPTVLGFHAVGDAHTCTNPFYGRGCSLALVQATLLADAFAAHPADPAARSVAYEAASTREVEPWYHSSVFSDSQRQSGDATSETDQFTQRFGALVLEVMFGAVPDPVVARGLMRLVNMLVRPDELFTDTDFVTRVGSLLSDPQGYGSTPAPTRVERDTLLSALAA